MDCKVCHFRICVCSKGWKTFDANFEKIPDLNISTITMCIKFTHVGLNFERIVNQFFQRQKKSPDTFTYTLEYKQNKTKKNETKLITATTAQKVHKKVEKGEQQMYNSINLKSYILFLFTFVSNSLFNCLHLFSTKILHLVSSFKKFRCYKCPLVFFPNL